ncbi:hypothetical protein BDW59DRAFT_177665 [Aspergillus cavernicola]|uniref:Linalool dehydratase/isomerase domain-containing protein n=1 Tax=Aspergillus cavernicola TaxID=176166 RepID=A0ABR4HJ26_9EURO
MTTISETKITHRMALKGETLPQKLDPTTQRDGYWGLMGSQDPGQEWLDAYRYQLATMAYAAGAAHFHRMPALRSMFKTLMQQLIAKMLKRAVWGYWFLTSHSGKFVDPDIEELRKPWADPIVRENIMYSGHLLLMVSLYTMLFNDDRYNEKGALTFHWNPMFWGLGPENFSYTRQSLQDAILAEMEREKWLGVCCEPNSIFIVCNQFPIIAFRYNDITDRTNIADDVLEKYTAAWKAKGMHQDNGLLIEWYSPKQNSKRPAYTIGFTAWAAAFMNSWNPKVAHQTFKTHTTGFLSKVEKDRVNVNSPAVAFAVRAMAHGANADPHSKTTIRQAMKAVHDRYPDGVPGPPYPSPIFGYVVQWASEVGDKETLTGLMNHADRYMNPTWLDGGLYYSASDDKTDEEGNWRTVDPFTGNAAIGYSRLNVLDGQRKMWLNPWTSEHLSQSPFIDKVDLASGVDFLRGHWDNARGAMVLTMRTWDGSKKNVQLECSQLPVGRYGIYYGDNLGETRDVNAHGDIIDLTLQVSGEELTVIVLRA